MTSPSSLHTDAPSDEQKDKVDEKQLAFADHALAQCTTYHGVGPTEETEAALVKSATRRTDAVLMPILALTVMLQFQDKFCLGYALVMGLKEDIGMSGAQYSWAGSIFYFGYLACQPVATLMLLRFSAVHYLAINCFIWGAIMCCHAASQGPQSFLALRFLLGIFEGGLIPCTTLLTANYYTKSQIVTRASILQCMNGVSILFGAPMAYCLLIRSDLVMQSWRVMFLILGAVTVVLSLFIAIVLAPSPSGARFLKSDERIALSNMLKRTSIDATRGSGSTRQQTIEALTDVRLYLMWLLPFAVCITNGGITVFSTALVKSFGFGNDESILLTMPSGAVQVVSVFVYVGLFRWTGTRAAGAITCLVFSVIGASLVVGCVGNQAASLTGILLVVFYVQSMAACVAYIATNVGGHTKRVIFSTSFQIAYAAGNIVGPQTYRPQDAPKYVPAQIAMLVTLAAALALIIAITYFHWTWNRQRDRRSEPQPGEHPSVEGLTDKQDTSFRYVY